METKRRIDIKVNICLFIFLLVVIFFGGFNEVLFIDRGALDKTVIIDMVFNRSMAAGIIVITGIIIIWTILVVIAAFFVRIIWNRLLVEVVNNVKPIDFQKALTISLLLSFLNELITLGLLR